MLESIRFQNFRGFKDLDLSGLSQITLLTGKNSAGKSSVLEGIFLLMGYALPDNLEKIRMLRGLPAASDITQLWESLFYKFDTSKAIEISAKCQGKHLDLKYERDDAFSTLDTNQNVINTFVVFSSSAASYYTLRYNFTADEAAQNGHLFLNPAIGPNGALAMTKENRKMGFETPNTQIFKFLSVGRVDDLELAGWLGTLNLRGDHQLIVDALKIIDPDIVDIHTVVQQRYTQLYLITKDSSIPLKLAGDGICKLLYCVLYVLCNQNSIVLIDEIENGFHYSMQESFWNTLAKAAKKSNTQIIATTHSYECIKHAVDGIANAGMQDNFSLHRIDRIGEESRATQYSGDLVKDAVDSLMEVR